MDLRDAHSRHVEAADLRVHLREWPPLLDQARAGAGEEAIVLVHGNWSTWRWWIPVAAALGERLPGHRVLAPDLRGRGDTRGPDHGYTLAELGEDLRALLDALGLTRVHLVGHSLGSGVAMQFARDHGERVASLVAIAPVWVDGMPAQWAAPERQAAAHADRELFGQMLGAMAPKFDEAGEHGELWQELVVTGHRQREAASYRNLDALSQWRPGNELRTLAMPRLVIDGELDPLCGGETARRAAEAMACERVQLEGIGHSPNLEAPGRVAELIADLLTRAG